MIGVVLWNDTSKNAAVIWCEDHGDLAFYYGDPTQGPSLHSGDCVRFRVELRDSLRHASDLTLIEGESHPDLAASLANIDVEAGSNSDPQASTDRAFQNNPDPRAGGKLNGEKTGELVLFPTARKPKNTTTARRAGTCRVVRMS